MSDGHVGGLSRGIAGRDPDDSRRARVEGGGFEVESELRPGFTIGYFRQAESVEAVVAVSGNDPAPVKDQVDLILAVEYNSKTLLLIGPKFDNDADDRAIASDFVEGIGVLGRTGALDPNSEFVKNILNDLKGIQSGGAAGSAIKLSAQPRTPRETEILSALKVSLRLN